MKKILFTIFSLFLLTACSQDELDVPAQLQQGKSETVQLTFNVKVPEVQSAASRAFGEDATLSTLSLVVFDDQGWFLYPAEATRNLGVNMTDETEFTVELYKSSSPRIIHFVGNCDVSGIGTGNHESAISSLNVTGKKDAYWQRIRLDEITDNVPDAMKPVHLVRNFAKITVTNGATDDNGSFKYTGFTVIHTESYGSVAPYIGGESVAFANYVQSDNACVTYDNLLGQGFKGSVPSASTAENTFNGTTFSETLTYKAEDTPYYMYERSNEDGATYLIIEGTWDGEETYYKVDILKEAENGPATYYNILRNFAYNITIDKVAGKGASSPEDAAKGAASNNIFASTDLQHLTNMSDGTARLFVNYTSKTLVSSAPVTLEFLFIPDYTDAPTTSANSSIQIQVGEGSAFENVSTAVHNSTNVENAGYSYITITPNEPGTLPKEQTITLYDTETGLQRTVKYTLREAYEFVKVETNGADGLSAIGDAFEYKFTLPDGMPESLFPMTFLIEAYPQTIYPNTGNDSNGDAYASMPATTLEQSFGYERTVTWEEYSASHTITCGFKVNTTDYATIISVSHDLFKTGMATLGTTTTETEGAFSNLTINGMTENAVVSYGVGQEVVVTFNMNIVDATTLVKITADKMASATSTTGNIIKNSDGTFTYAPTRKTGKQTITFRTAEYNSAGMITVSSGETGESKKYANSTVSGSYTNAMIWDGLAINGASSEATIQYNPDGTDVTITFNMPVIEDTNGDPITVTITASQLVYGDDTDGSYTYTPTAAGLQTITMKTDGQIHGSGTVEIEASSGYTTTQKVSFSNVLYIPAADLKTSSNINGTGWNATTRDVTVYSDSNYSNSVATGVNFSSSDPYAMTSDLTITLSEGMTTLYFSYTGSGQISSTTYKASASISNILNGTTLTFSK